MALTIPIFVGQNVGGNIQPVSSLSSTNFTIRLASSTGTTISFSTFSNEGNGNYVFGGFTIPASSTAQGAEVNVAINGSLRSELGTFVVYANGDEPWTAQKTIDLAAARLDRGVGGQLWNAGCDTIFGQIQADDSVPESSMTGNSRKSLIHKFYVDDNFATTASVSGIIGFATGSLTSGYVTINTEQVITGAKTLYLSSTGFKMQMQSNPQNGGVIGWHSKPLADNQMLHDFKNSGLTGTGHILCSTASINTSSSKYILGNLVSNDFVHKKFLDDNFQPIVSSFQSNTVYVDARATENIPLKTYSSITGALAGILEETGGTTSANIWSIIIKQHYNTSGYVENIELPDWVNIAGEGMVNIFGQLTRSTTGSQVTSKLQNLIITNGGLDHAVERIEGVDCVFITADNIDLERSNLRNCEFYAGAIIQSSDNNKIKGCFFNRSVAWQTSDVVRNPDYLIGASYN